MILREESHCAGVASPGFSLQRGSRRLWQPPEESRYADVASPEFSLQRGSHLCVLEAHQARVKAHRRHHLSVLEVARRHHQLCVLGARHTRVKSLGEAYNFVDLDGVPLEEEEEEEASEVVDLDGVPLEEEEEEWIFEPDKLQLFVVACCPGPEGHHLTCLEEKGIVPEG